VIALTANAVAGNEKMFLDNGFQAFISKPIELNRLDTVIRQWVRDKEKEKQLEIHVNGNVITDTRKSGERRTVSSRRCGLDRRKFGELYYEINVKKGLERFGGDKEIYFGILRSFAVNTKPLLEKIKEVNKENLNDYAITAHGIKGSGRGIFADAIGDKAESLEKAAKAGDFDFIRDNNTDFIKTVEKLIADIEKMLAKLEEENPKPKKDAPDKDMLKMLLKACKKYDMDGVDAVMAELEQYEYESEGELVESLRKDVDEADFLRITEQLSYLDI
ncbi:MAG: hypothetical protein FWG06_04520, partial [Clostridiales bacterium]|nr:hypothetical protein [Clostridiales bacterium]